MVPSTLRLRIAAALCVIPTALAVYTSDALPFHWQVVAVIAVSAAAVMALQRRFPRAWYLPGLLPLTWMLVSRRYYGLPSHMTFYQNLHDVFVFLAVFADVALVFAFVSPRAATRRVTAQRSASA